MKLMKHINNTDVAAEFLRVVRIPRGAKVKVCWYNIVNPKNIYPIGIVEEVFIPTEKLTEWKVWAPQEPS